VTTLCGVFSIQMKSLAYLGTLQEAPKPVDLVRRLEERVIAENSRMLSLDNIVDFADRFADDIPDTLNMFRDK
jgi:hypothetical protein